ncbi:putative repeat protein (TIGR03843 family) [Arthrobacter sp. V4I6]|uniref:SCO1664 family protein n=1 Tax=unclassified Arthrobacter TaxID=235627 RepID=UPI00278A0562|nr:MULTISPECIES: SCO1664 family protein [unclassified Arthrobacter]MDQ0819467.1 putative repeat protein (TIGR03843 family) [Arthrobacter sp. V1I7]MDQ0853649.1 putative repeat protein (TIGR03843 family) [Arthrobacter sp. V4I6]
MATNGETDGKRGQPVSGRELTLLAEGRVELLGRLPRSSNETFLVEISCGNDTAYAVYKPEAGERPLSDFEPGLYRRERAAYLLSESLDWGLVPTTVIRGEAPLGIGSLQWFIECDFREHYFTLYADAPETHRDLSQIALFDYIANNTDRKSGHVLRGDDGRVWGIDHGLCFSASFKLRTVIWDFAGDPIPSTLLGDIAPLAEAVPPEVAELLDDEEVGALQHRVQRLLHAGVLPVDRSGMRYPWPLV